MKSATGIPLLFVLVLTSCVPTTFLRNGNLQNYVVEFTAAPGDNMLKVHSSPVICSNGKKGCIEFAKGQLGTITFQFAGAQKEKDCNTMPAANWVITRIELSGSGDPATDKGVFGGKQPLWLTSAFPGIDSANGLIYESTPDKAARSVTLIDLNNNAEDRIVYYQVTASNCDAENPETIATDPSIRNRGK